MEKDSEIINQLLLKISKLEKINFALMKRVEGTYSNQSNAFLLFEGNILLEQEIKRKTRELDDAKIVLDRLKKSLDAAVLISETDLKGIITDVNDLFVLSSGFSKEELIGSPHGIISSGKYDGDFWENFWLLIMSGETFKGEICNKRKDGSLYWVDTTIFPKFNESNQVVGFFSVSIDITKRKESESQLLHQTKLASIGELAAGVGHEINNPLAISVGNLAALKKQIDVAALDKALFLDRIAKIEQGHERIRKIVDGLRVFSRADEDTDVGSVDLARIIDDTLSLIDEIYLKEGVEIIKDYSGQSSWVEASDGKLQQVIMNLLSNAKDATENRTQRTITISIFSEHDQAGFIIKDNGIGIPENLRDKIMNPFFTTKTVGKGTGIGLGVVHGIVSSFGGEIKIESEENVGTSFIVTLKKSEEGRSMSEHFTQKEEGNEYSLEGTVLVVDDEVGIRELLVDYMEDLGLVVEQAASGKEALMKVAQSQYDYICTDLKMPHMSGDQFILQAKKITPSKTKFFVITGGVSLQDNLSEEALYQLVDGVIAKPFTDESIFNALSKGK